jgi:hypothetical protein
VTDVQALSFCEYGHVCCVHARGMSMYGCVRHVLPGKPQVSNACRKPGNRPADRRFCRLRNAWCRNNLYFPPPLFYLILNEYSFAYQLYVLKLFNPAVLQENNTEDFLNIL